MKTRIAAGLVCLAAALGLGAGAANAAEAPAEQSPALAGITLDMPAVDLQAPDAPASPLLPQRSRVRPGRRGRERADSALSGGQGGPTQSSLSVGLGFPCVQRKE